MVSIHDNLHFIFHGWEQFYLSNPKSLWLHQRYLEIQLSQVIRNSSRSRNILRPDRESSRITIPIVEQILLCILSTIKKMLSFISFCDYLSFWWKIFNFQLKRFFLFLLSASLNGANSLFCWHFRRKCRHSGEA